MARENKKVEGSGEASKQSASGTKTPKSLKAEPKIVKKTPSQNIANVKNSKGPQSNKEKPEQANNIDRKKGKHVANKNKSEKTPRKDQRDGSSKEKIGGMIFMCNAKTKADCFSYMVMGLPQSKKEVVARIKPGLKLFLFDFDAKLVYGIYKAASAGGMKLEPDAFNGTYPAQVRFTIHMDCSPISEGTFKKAIMGNSGGDKIKFNTELTTEQAKKLTNLFRPSSQLNSNVNTLVHSSHLVPMPLRPMISAMEPPMHQVVYPQGALVMGRHAYSMSREETTPVKRETFPRDILSLSEKEYRTYGLRREPQVPAPAPVPSSALDPSHGIRVSYNTYSLPSPRRAAYLSEMDRHNNLSQRRRDETEYNKLRPSSTGQLGSQPASYLDYSSGVARWSEIGYGRRVAEADRSHSTRAANALSDYNKSYGAGDSGNLSVSSRYSFAGPSFM